MKSPTQPTVTDDKTVNETDSKLRGVKILDTEAKRLELMIRATSEGALRIDRVCRIVKKLQDDPNRKARLDCRKCKACFYMGGGIAGAAMTDYDCAFCGQRCFSGSTNVSKLCDPCAKANDLCVHCGADIELNENRRKVARKK
jgi:hypothetical protein